MGGPVPLLRARRPADRLDRPGGGQLKVELGGHLILLFFEPVGGNVGDVPVGDATVRVGVVDPVGGLLQVDLDIDPLFLILTVGGLGHIRRFPERGLGGGNVVPRDRQFVVFLPWNEVYVEIWNTLVRDVLYAGGFPSHGRRGGGETNNERFEGGRSRRRGGWEEAMIDGEGHISTPGT